MTSGRSASRRRTTTWTPSSPGCGRPPRSWVPSHFRNGKRIGDELRLANIQGDKPRKQGSCVIALEGERAGDWIDFDDNQGGGPLSTLEHATGLTGRALIEYAAELAGSAPVNGVKHPIAERVGKEQRAESTAREIELILARADAARGHGRRDLPRQARAASFPTRPTSCSTPI